MPRPPHLRVPNCVPGTSERSTPSPAYALQAQRGDTAPDTHIQDTERCISRRRNQHQKCTYVHFSCTILSTMVATEDPSEHERSLSTGIHLAPHPLARIYRIHAIHRSRLHQIQHRVPYQWIDCEARLRPETRNTDRSSNRDDRPVMTAQPESQCPRTHL